MSLLSIALCMSLGAHATTASEILEQARSVQRADTAIQQMRMTIVSKNGAERVRAFELRVRRDGEIIKSYARFSEPSDVAGTQLVMVDHPDRTDDQLLYLPALKRTNRIAGKARTGAFMGSDYAYEDLELSGGSEGQHSVVNDEAETWTIESIPAAGSSYGKLRTTVRKADHFPTAVSFYDQKGALLKELVVTETETSGSHVLPVKSTMKNVQRGTMTRLEIVSHEIGVPVERIPDETFSAAFMERND